MSRLQTCHSCGAQFDVSSFSPGQQFSCGACGAVLTANAAAAPGKAPGKAPGRVPGGAGGAPKGRTPGGSAVQGRAPGSRAGSTARGGGGAPAGGTGRRGAGARPATGGRAGPAKGKSSRGPQYRPPERHQETTAAAAAAPGRPARAGRGAKAAAGGGRARGGRRGGAGREPQERAPKSGFNPALLYGGAGLVVVVVVALLVLSGNKGGADENGGQGTNPITAGGGNGGPNGSNPAEPAAPDTLASLKKERREAKLRKPGDYRALATRFLALGGDDAQEQARELYTALIEEVDENDAVARKFLGYTDFQADILGEVLQEGGDPIPEEVANRHGYPWVDAVNLFNSRRWLDDEEEIELAKEAVAEMREHAQKLTTDRLYRAGDKIRANVALDPLLAGLNYKALWAPPYLICYSSSDSLSAFDLLKEESKAERRKMKQTLLDKQKEWDGVLREKAAVYQGLFKEWMRRYGERLGLKPLTDPWGGRPDLKPGVRSFQDGVPLVVWIFTDNEAFQKYHEERKGGRLPAGVGGYFTPSTGYIYLFDMPPGSTEARMDEINTLCHEGTHQLEYWFGKQVTRWGKANVGQDAFSEGIAEYLGSVEMDENRKLTFTGVNHGRLKSMIEYQKQYKEQNKDYPIIPLQKLISFQNYNQCMQWAQSELGIPGGVGLMLLYQQGWAMTLFFNEYKNGKFKEKWLDFLAANLRRETDFGQSVPTFKRIFKLRDEDDWDDLEAEYEKWLLEDLLKRDPAKYMYKPPKRGEWPE